MEDKRFYGRRHGKPIRESRQKLLTELLPQVALPAPVADRMADLSSVFGICPHEVWLEIGFGGGEHVADMALRYPDVGIIGAEPFVNGVASLLAHLNGSHQKPVQHSGLSPDRPDNVRIWPDDIRPLFPLFPAGCFERIFLLYPDPWPKARHAERRFINSRNIPHLARLLSDTGALYLATDVADYAAWALDQMALSDLFVQVHPDPTCPPDDWIPTRYERKGIAAGRKPTYLIFRKKVKKK